MPELRHPTVAQIRKIHLEVLARQGGADGVREEALLESAVNAPQASMMGLPVFTDPIEIAAAYLFYLCRTRSLTGTNVSRSPHVWHF